MALTKKDLGLIKDIFRDEFANIYAEILSPRFDRLEGRMDRLEGRMDSMEGRMDVTEGKLGRLEAKMDEYFFDLKEQIDDNTKLIGYYFEKCATKDEVNALAQRVTALETCA